MPHLAKAVIDRMINAFDRCGKSHQAKFYDYLKEGKKSLWPDWYTIFVGNQELISRADMKNCILFIQAIETVRCLEEDINVGNIFGIGLAGLSITIY